MVIRTRRLDLVPATVEILEAELGGPAALEVALGTEIPSSWPPPLCDEAAVRWALERLQEDPDFERWGFRYFVLRREHRTRHLVVGAGGYKGPPDPSATVEIGYSVLPEFQRRGFANEATSGLLAYAFSSGLVARVTAQTFPGLWPSISVLDRNGFRFAGTGSEEGAVRYAITRREFRERVGRMRGGDPPWSSPPPG